MVSRNTEKKCVCGEPASDIYAGRCEDCYALAGDAALRFTGGTAFPQLAPTRCGYVSGVNKSGRPYLRRMIKTLAE